MSTFSEAGDAFMRQAKPREAVAAYTAAVKVARAAGDAQEAARLEKLAAASQKYVAQQADDEAQKKTQDAQRAAEDAARTSFQKADTAMKAGDYATAAKLFLATEVLYRKAKNEQLAGLMAATAKKMEEKQKGAGTGTAKTNVAGEPKFGELPATPPKYVAAAARAAAEDKAAKSGRSTDLIAAAYAHREAAEIAKEFKLTTFQKKHADMQAIYETKGHKAKTAERDGSQGLDAAKNPLKKWAAKK